MTSKGKGEARTLSHFCSSSFVFYFFHLLPSEKHQIARIVPGIQSIEVWSSKIFFDIFIFFKYISLLCSFLFLWIFLIYLLPILLSGALMIWYSNSNGGEGRRSKWKYEFLCVLMRWKQMELKYINKSGLWDLEVKFPCLLLNSSSFWK